MAIVAPKSVQVHPPSSRINYIRRPAPSHSNTPQALTQVLMLRRLFPSLSAAFCISIASTARTVLARAGLRNLSPMKVLHGIAGNQVFGERLDATARSLNDYFVYFLVTVRGTALRTSSCIDVVRLHQARSVE